MGDCIGVSIVITMLLLQYALRVLHITLHSLEDNPCLTDGCEEGPWKGAQGLEVAATDDPTNHIYGDGSDSRLYER